MNDDNDDDAAAISVEMEKAADAVRAWRWGAEMGTWMFLGYAFQAIGLAYTTAQRSGFLLYLNVKFVPFFAFVLLGRKISGATWASALVAFGGTALLSADPGSGTPINVGDLWSVAAAMASAMFILRMEKATERVNDSAALNAATLWIVALLALVWTGGEGVFLQQTQPQVQQQVQQHVLSYPFQTVQHIVQAHPVAVLYLGVVSTALANYLQTVAQQGISAERASVIYAMDPVYGAIFANLLLGEKLGNQGLVGAGAIAVAAATNAFLDFGNIYSEVVLEEEEEEEELEQALLSPPPLVVQSSSSSSSTVIKETAVDGMIENTKTNSTMLM